MENNDDTKRSRPSEDEKDNDPNLRDETALPPGVQTISGSSYDEANQHLTKTASDNFSPDTDFGKGADPAFDEIDNENATEKDIKNKG